MTGTDWAEAALGGLLGRVARTAEEVGDRFPLYAAPTGGPWRTTARGSWAGGFWTGLLAVRAAVTGAEADRGPALAARDRLAYWVAADTVCRGLIFWYGDTGHLLGLWGPSPTTVAAGRALADAFDERLGAVPWGGAFGGDPTSVRPDGAAGTVPLLAWSAARAGGPVHGARLAGWHLRTTLSAGTPQWSRGRAWLLLGCVDAAAWLDPTFLGSACELAAGWGSGAVSSTDGSTDSSADCIAAVALIKLGELDPGAGWRDRGTDLLRKTVGVAQIRDGPARGGIGRGCYDATAGVAVDHELVWGDFFAAFGLGLVTGALGAPAHRSV